MHIFLWNGRIIIIIDNTTLQSIGFYYEILTTAEDDGY